jgi:thioredoxin-like negative regulator of GroEL
VNCRKTSVAGIAVYVVFLAAVGAALFIPQGGNKEEKGEAAAMAQITSGMPALLEFTSPTCNVCKEMAPIVKKLKEEFKGKVEFVEVSVDSEEGQRLSEEYKVDALPAFFLFNESHQVVQRFELKVPEEMLRQMLVMLVQKHM